MSTLINGVTFFQNNLVATHSHRSQTVPFTPELADFLTARHIYTRSRHPGSHRIHSLRPVRLPVNLQIEPYSQFLFGRHFFSMGAFSSTNSNLPVNTIIGRYSSIATNVTRMQGSHPTTRFTTSMLTYDDRVTAFNDYLGTTENTFERKPSPVHNGGPIVIGNDVWIGQDVRFTPAGATVGDGAVIAGGALVTKDVPAYAVVGGIPARVLKYRFPQAVIDQLIALKWWQYGFGDFHGVTPDEPIESFIDKIGNLVATDAIQPFKPDSTSFDDLIAAAKQPE
ncbi:hypothetical protein IV54_GL000139 [Levilactobacillus paucivorans]|uniref:Acetyltransferase n=1 Tax=Levilactobacillus paucivorans TaxID=616990 RepID=A0A0R2LP38_9LACO|nr:CatB-related O-acetyltransferase [Levilactobacillus paucivorans]KRO03550.1 hypothetical protein IV54_GL000139 [Levilactobacillus paucivorans]